MHRFGRPAPARSGPEVLVGHGSQVERAVQLVRRGTSVAVVGERWSGRSTALDAICRGLEDLGREVRHVPSAWRWPAPRPGEVSVSAKPARHPVPSGLDDALEAMSPESDVVVVDDVDRLDEGSREALRALHRRSRVPFVTTRLSQGRRPETGRVAEIACDPVELPLTPLSFEELHTLLQGRLAGRLSPELTARVLRDSAGLPGLAVAYLDGAITRGTVREVAGVWVGEDLWSAELHGRYGAVLAPLGDGALAAAELLARIGTVPVDVAERMLDHALIDALEDRGLVQVVAAGGRYQLTLRPPGLTEHLTRRPMSARLLRTLANASAALADTRQPLEPQAREVLSRIDGWIGRGAAAQAHAPEVTGPGSDVVLDHALREGREVALAAWQQSHSAGDAVRLLHGLGAGQRDAALVETVLAGTDRDGAQGFEAAELRYLEARFAIMGGRDVQEVTGELIRAVQEGAAPRSLIPLALLLRAEFLALPADGEAQLTPLLDGEPDEARAARVALAAHRVIGGRHAAAAELLAVDRSGWPRLLIEGAELVLGLAEYGSGDFAAVVARGSALVVNGAGSASGSACGCGYLLTALGLAAQGKLEQARGHLLPALSLPGGWSGLFSPERSVRGMLGYVAMLGAHEALAPGCVALVNGVTSSGDALPFSAGALPEAMELHVAGSPELAAQALDEVVRDLRSRGLALAADTVEVVRLLLRHDPDLGRQASAAVRRVGGLPFATFLQAWQARVSEDPDALIEVAERFDRLDLPVEAARCYATAAGLYREAGDQVAAGRARRAIHALQAADLSGQVPDDRTLTEREREIIGQIAKGYSNAQVASQLLLSVRTVETHLRNIRRKTGLQDRKEIGRLAE